jgi:hypothetical protein
VTGLTASNVKIFVAGGDRNTGKADSAPVAANIGDRAMVQANIYAPNGTISFKNRSQGTGAFIGKHVIIGTSARLTLDSSFF